MTKQLKYKICGLTDRTNIQSLIQLKPHFMGFIFHEPSLRYIHPQQARELIKLIPENITTIGVFVDQSACTVHQICHMNGIRGIQYHGQETPEQCDASFRNGFMVIKAFGIRQEDDFKQVHSYEGTCHYYLFDAKGEYPGGNGKSFDWELLKNYKLNTPFLLAGGIQSEDWKQLSQLHHNQFAGIDLNSGFEIIPGIKNVEKLKKFINSLDRTFYESLKTK